MKQLENLVAYIDNFQKTHRLSGFIYAVLKKYGQDGTGYKSALLTYYSFLALFPLLMVLTTLSNHILGNNPDLANRIISGVTDYFPVLGNSLEDYVHGLSSNGAALVLGILITIYGTRGVADVYTNSVREIWGYKGRLPAAFPGGLLRNLGLIFVAGFGFIVAAILSGLAAGAGHGIGFRLLSWGINLTILFWLFNFLLETSLPKHVTFKETRVGAACAAVGLVLIQSFGTKILSRELHNLDVLYGYFAITLGLLFWIYLQVQVVMYANQIAVVSAKKLWPRSFSEPPNK